MHLPGFADVGFNILHGFHLGRGGNERQCTGKFLHGTGGQAEWVCGDVLLCMPAHMNLEFKQKQAVKGKAAARAFSLTLVVREVQRAIAPCHIGQLKARYDIRRQIIRLNGRDTIDSTPDIRPQSLLRHSGSQMVHGDNPVHVQLSSGRPGLLERRLHQLRPIKRVLQPSIEIVVMSHLQPALHKPIIEPHQMKCAASRISGARLDQQDLAANLSDRKQTCLDKDHLAKRVTRQRNGAAQVQIPLGSVKKQVGYVGNTELCHDLSHAWSYATHLGYGLLEHVQQSPDGFFCMFCGCRFLRQGVARVTGRNNWVDWRALQKCKHRPASVDAGPVGQELIVDKKGAQLIGYAGFARGPESSAGALDRRQRQLCKSAYGSIILTATLQFQAHQTMQKFLPRLWWSWPALTAHRVQISGIRPSSYDMSPRKLEPATDGTPRYSETVAPRSANVSRTPR